MARLHAISRSHCRKDVVKRIRAGEVRFDGEIWKVISAEAKNFITSLLILDPAQRLTAKAAMSHSFVTNSNMLCPVKPDPSFSPKVVRNLLRYSKSNIFKKIALFLVARKMTPDEILDLRMIFSEFDTSHDGTISFEEFKAALAQYHYTEEKLATIFRSIVSCAYIFHGFVPL